MQISSALRHSEVLKGPRPKQLCWSQQASKSEKVSAPDYSAGLKGTQRAARPKPQAALLVSKDLKRSHRASSYAAGLKGVQSPTGPSARAPQLVS